MLKRQGHFHFAKGTFMGKGSPTGIKGFGCNFCRSSSFLKEKSRKAKEERLRAEAERATREAIEQERKEALSAAALDFSSHSVHVDYEPGSEGKHVHFGFYT